jgi:hypothetical protein
MGTLIAELTSAVRRTSKRSLIGWCAVSGQAPCSGAKRQGKGLDEVSSAIHGDAVAMNVKFSENRALSVSAETAG